MPYFDFTKNPLQRRDTSPYQSLLSGALGGYQQGQKFKQEGQQFEQEQEKRALSNEEQAMMNNLLKLYGEEKEKADLAYKKSLTANQNSLAAGGASGQEGALTNIGKVLKEREAAVNKYGENSPQVGAIDGYIKKLTSSGSNANNSVTSPVKTSALKAILANEQRVYLDKFMNHKYQGTGSNVLLAKDIARYRNEKDPAKKAEIEEELVRAGVALKVAPEFGGLQLAGQSIQPTVHALSKQEKAIKQGWAEGLRLGLTNLPPELTRKINERHSEVLRDSSRIRNDSYQRLINGEKNNEFSQPDEQQSQSSNMADEYGYTPEDYEYTASQRGISVEEIKKILQEGR